MRRIVYSTLLFLLLSLSAVAQNGGINFQGMARTAAGEPLANQKISLRLSVLLNSESGTVEYSETKEVTTSGQGIFSVVVGDGSILSKTGDFSDINWKNSPKFLKVEMDPSGGTNFALLGTSRLQAVPFAYYANGVDADNIQGTLPIAKGGTGVGSITAFKTSLGIDQINNTADANKPLSTAAQTALNTKVDKVTGKELSSNDYSVAEKTKLAAISGTNTGDQDLSGLATTAALAGKVDKVNGKELSSNDYTTAEKTKLAAITGTNTGDQDLSGYATTAALASKANTSDVTSSLALKANTADVTTALAGKANTTEVTAELAGKVDKVSGKELSSNDYSTAEKNKLAAISGTNTGDQTTITGNAGTASKLATPKNINGIPFDGSNDINVPAAAGTLTGTTLNSTVTGSSLTSIGTLANLTVTNPIVGSITGNAATATSATIASTVTTNANLTGPVTSVGNATTITDGAITTSKIATGAVATASIADAAITNSKVTDVAATKITGTLPVANGGTGLSTTPSNGQLDIGNGTGFTRATLTAGTGISITNTSGAVTIASTAVPSGAAIGDMLYWSGSEWVKIAAGSNGQILSIIGNTPTWQKPAIPSMGLTDVYNHKTGKVWMDRNLGATQVATSSTDEQSYGDLYQWGRGADGHQSRTSSTTSDLSSSDVPGTTKFILAPNSPYDWRSDQNANLWQGVNVINNPCPSGYRLPTEAEWENERLSWESSNFAYNAAFASPLKLPMAGRRIWSNGSLISSGSVGYYWSSTVSTTYSRYLSFSQSASTSFDYRASGFSVRCIKE